MKKLFLLLLFTPSALVMHGQIIGGCVLDKETGQPVEVASIFVDGSFHGTITDEKGNFSIDMSGFPGRSIHISAIGYHTAVLDPRPGTESYIIYLKRAVYHIVEVSVEAESLLRKRKQCMRIFNNEFLGRSNNAKDCHILNEDALTFNYGSDRDTLRAYIREPLIILNNALGYRITYFLEEFEYIRADKTTRYTGNISFEQDMAKSGEHKEEIEQRRNKTYKGSDLHFFRSLWTGRLHAEGFYVQKVNTAEPLPRDEYVIADQEGNQYFSYGEDLEISYDHYLTTVKFLQRRVYYDKDGFFDPEAIMWFGYISHARIADRLPYEYKQE